MRNINIRLATLATISSLVIMLLTIQPVSAATQMPSSSSSTRITAITVSAGLCTQLKADFPQQASNPKLCTVYHAESMTGQTSAGPYKGACPGGTRSFRDTYWDAAILNWSLQLNTWWQWNNDCRAPALTGQQHYVNYYYLPVTGIGNQDFYTYYTGIPSQAAVYSAVIQVTVGGYGVWQRRECYENMSCNWHTDNG